MPELVKVLEVEVEEEVEMEGMTAKEEKEM